MAAKLIDPRKLKPRAELREEIKGLETGIEELRGEKVEFEGVWEGRREVFERVVREGRVLVGVVRGVKEEVEEEKGAEDEGMEVDEGDEGQKGAEGSQVGTPAANGDGRTPVRREMTPALEEEEGGEEGDAAPALPTNKFLDVHDDDNNHATRRSSRAASPIPDNAHETTDDVEMAEDDDEPPALEAQPKTTAGMEVTGDQVATPADGMEGAEDQAPEAAVGVEEDREDLEEMNAVAVAPLEVAEDDVVATPGADAEEMDES